MHTLTRMELIGGMGVIGTLPIERKGFVCDGAVSRWHPTLVDSAEIQ
jgi:hypothetical protein